jgi:hypothetical protein
MILDRASNIIPDDVQAKGPPWASRLDPCSVIRINGSLYFEHPTALSIIIISARGSTNKKEVILVLVAIQAIVIQERSTVVKALDFYYRDRNKLDSFFILIDIYILFN